ncbi:MAG: hypothetical protein IT356_03770 [Gemmatimonadaceae bacterium]|nr:hypothetical protein [Gemmatimonadaceae bacterium]
MATLLDPMTRDVRWDLAPEMIVPPPGTGACLPPEQQLMLAVLENGVATLLKNVVAEDCRGRRLYAEAVEWVASDETGWLFAFVSICHVLGLDPDCLRLGLQRCCARQAAGEVPAPPRSPFRQAHGARRSSAG